MIEHDDIEPCLVEKCQQEQIGLKAIQDNYIIYLANEQVFGLVVLTHQV